MSVGVFGIYALTNAWFVARGVGPKALAAVSLVAPVLLILGAVSATVGAGGASVVSRRLGAGDPAGAGRAAGNAFAVFWTAAILTTVGGLAAIEPLLTLLGATGPVRDYARDYAVIILTGAVFSTGFSSLVRAEGRMRYSTLLWVLPVAVHIALDPLLIFGLHLGVRGAALGTVGGQVVSAAMGAWFFFGQRRRPYRIRAADLHWHGPTVRALAAVGAPSFLSGFGATALAVLVNNALVHAGGATALAAYAVCSRIQTFVLMPQLGISLGLQPVVGYNASRQQFDRVQRARILSLRATLGYGTVVAAAVFLFADRLVSGFIDDADTANTATHALRLIASGFTVAGITPLISAYFQALGRPTPSYLISVGTLLAIKAPLVLATAPAGATGIWAGLALGELLSALTAVFVLRRARPPSGRPTPKPQH